MSKLPLGTCPCCKHDIWDNDADFKGQKLSEIQVVCIYCGAAMQYDLLAGRYVEINVSALPRERRVQILGAQITQKLIGPELMQDELARRNRERKTS